MRPCLIWLYLPVLFIVGCANQQSLRGMLGEGLSQKTQLEIRQMQTRMYNTKDRKMVMKAVLNVLQDDAFIVKQADIDLGLLSATKESEHYWHHSDGIRTKSSIIDCNANISEFGDEMRVRINFRVKFMNNKGRCVLARRVDDPKYYQDFFSKVDKGIFIEKQHL